MMRAEGSPPRRYRRESNLFAHRLQNKEANYEMRLGAYLFRFAAAAVRYNDGDEKSMDLGDGVNAEVAKEPLNRCLLRALISGPRPFFLAIPSCLHLFRSSLFLNFERGYSTAA